MNECAAARVARVGVDLSKRVYQVHAVDRSGKVVLTQQTTRSRTSLPRATPGQDIDPHSDSETAQILKSVDTNFEQIAQPRNIYLAESRQAAL
jgi:hypothetical protein